MSHFKTGERFGGINSRANEPEACELINGAITPVAKRNVYGNLTPATNGEKEND